MITLEMRLLLKMVLQLYMVVDLSNPLTLTNSSTAMRIKHFDHGMYSTSNNVRITGASSGISTTLNGGLTTATSLTLTSNTGFAVIYPQDVLLKLIMRLCLEHCLVVILIV